LLSVSLMAAAFSTPRLSVHSHGRHRHTRTPTSTPSLLCDGTFGLIATQGDYLDSMNGLFADPVTRNFGVVSAFAAAKVYGEVTNLNRVNASGWAVWLGIAYGFTGAFTYRQVHPFEVVPRASAADVVPVGTAPFESDLYHASNILALPAGSPTALGALLLLVLVVHWPQISRQHPAPFSARPSARSAEPQMMAAPKRSKGKRDSKVSEPAGSFQQKLENAFGKDVFKGLVVLTGVLCYPLMAYGIIQKAAERGGL